MASWGVCLLSLILICNITAEQGCEFVSLKCNDNNNGRLGQQSLLECIVVLSQEAPDVRIEKIIWKKKGAPLIEYKRGENLPGKPGFTLAEPRSNVGNLNVSMLVTNTRMADVGKYTCLVDTNRGPSCPSSTTLSLSATDSSPTIGVTVNNQTVSTPSCNDGHCERIIGGVDKHAPNPDSQLASKVVPPVVVVLVIIGLLFFLKRRFNKRTHEEIPTDNQDLRNGEHQPNMV